MESAKLALFLLFFVSFTVVTRRLFSGNKTPNPLEMPPQPPPDSWDDYPDSRRPAIIGAEMPFPVVVPPIQRLPSGSYNRPNVLNYYFSNLDLKRGPENPRSFCDQFFVEFESPSTGAVWTNEYTVATPFGFQDLLDQSGENMAFYGTIIIVSRWDLAEILRTVMDDVMDKYADADDRRSREIDPHK